MKRYVDGINVNHFVRLRSEFFGAFNWISCWLFYWNKYLKFKARNNKKSLMRMRESQHTGDQLRGRCRRVYMLREIDRSYDIFLLASSSSTFFLRFIYFFLASLSSRVVMSMRFYFLWLLPARIVNPRAALDQ